MLRNVAYYANRGKGAAASRQEEDGSRPARSASRPRSNPPFPRTPTWKPPLTPVRPCRPLPEARQSPLRRQTRWNLNLVFEEA